MEPSLLVLSCAYRCSLYKSQNTTLFSRASGPRQSQSLGSTTYTPSKSLIQLRQWKNYNGMASGARAGNGSTGIRSWSKVEERRGVGFFLGSCVCTVQGRGRGRHSLFCGKSCSREEGGAGALVAVALH